MNVSFLNLCGYLFYFFHFSSFDQFHFFTKAGACWSCICDINNHMKWFRSVGWHYLRYPGWGTRVFKVWTRPCLSAYLMMLCSFTDWFLPNKGFSSWNRESNSERRDDTSLQVKVKLLLKEQHVLRTCVSHTNNNLQVNMKKGSGFVNVSVKKNLNKLPAVTECTDCTTNLHIVIFSWHKL